MSDLNICTSALQGGPDNSSKPFVWLKLESINNFDDPATVKTLTPQIYQFLQSELQFEKVGLLSSYPLSFPYPVHILQYSSFSVGLDYSDLSQVGGDPCGQQGQDLGRGINH